MLTEVCADIWNGYSGIKVSKLHVKVLEFYYYFVNTEDLPGTLGPQTV